MTPEAEQNGGATPRASRSVSLRGLTKSFGETVAVDSLDLEVEAGEIVALLGPSGCGKTTTLRMIAGLEMPDAGSVVVGGELLSGGPAYVPAERRRIGMVFQDYALFPHLDVAANVGYALGRRPDQARVAEVLEIVGLSDHRERPVHGLSGGEQQRVALARALAPAPGLVLLDEPFSNLDASLRGRLREEVRSILSAVGVTAVLVTHDQEEALSVADRVAVMRDGRAEQVGTPEEVYLRPSSRWVAGFLGEMDVLPGHASGGTVSYEFGTVSGSSVLSGDVDVLVRPEAVALGLSGPAGAPEARVVHRAFYGHDQMLKLQLPSGHIVRSRRLSFPAWHPGDRVRVWIDGPTTVLPKSEAGAPEPARSG